MRHDPTTPRFAKLVTAMNLIGAISATGSLGTVLELRRQGFPVLAAMESGVTAWIWPIELWASSVWVSRWLVRSGRLNLAALTALLPMLSTLSIRVLQIL